MDSDTERQQRPFFTGYHFVVEQDPSQPSQIRRHVARRRWIQRKAPGILRNRRTLPRHLAPASTASISTASTSTPSTLTTSTSDSADVSIPLGGSSSKDIFFDVRLSLEERTKKWTTSRILNSSPDYLSPYQSLGYADLDPFNGVRLSREDQQLLHHWVNVYAYRAFGQPTDGCLSPLSNLFVPVNLSERAFTHIILAHSANHMAYLLGRPSPVSAICHKIAAIKLINEALQDPETGVSDQNLEAVMNLLLFERYWGTEDEWLFHKRGFNQMVKQRGGFSGFRGNWRIEMHILIATMQFKPQWLLEVVATPTRGAAKPHSKFVNLFSQVAIPGPEVLLKFSALGRALQLLKPQAQNSSPDFKLPLPSEEMERLACLFYISLVLRWSRSSHTKLQWLNDFLERTEQVWSDSTPTLRWLLTQSVGKGPGGLKDVWRIERLAEIAKVLKSPSSRPLEDRYLDILLQDPVEAEDLFSLFE